MGGGDKAAWQIGVSYRDQDFSIVDRTNFAVMRRLGIERAASLDDDFAIFRFGPNRRRAFTILRRNRHVVAESTGSLRLGPDRARSELGLYPIVIRCKLR